MTINRLRIVSDGRPRGTKIIDTKTGEDLTKQLLLKRISWALGAGTDDAEVTLVLTRLPVELEGRVASVEVRAWLDERQKASEAIA